MDSPKNYEAVKLNILEVAREIFSKSGFHKTTMDEIAQSARKGKSTIYYYFRDKEDIFRGVVEQEAQILRQKLISVVSENYTPKEKLKTYINTRISALKELANFYDALKKEYLNNLAFIEDVRAKYDREEFTLIKMILIEGIDKKVFEINDIDVTTDAILTSLKGIEMPLILGRQTYVDNENRLDNLLQVLYYGIAKK